MNRTNRMNRFVSVTTSDVNTSMVVAGRNGFGTDAASAYPAASHSWSGCIQLPQPAETERGIASRGERRQRCSRPSLRLATATGVLRLAPAGKRSKRLPAGSN